LKGLKGSYKESAEERLREVVEEGHDVRWRLLTGAVVEVVE
jgi:hypothetical protein